MVFPRYRALLRRTVILAVALSIAELGLSQSRPDCPIPPASLEAMRECYRPLLVFTPDPHDARFLKQQTLLDQYADEMMDRFVLYVPVLPEGSKFEPPLDAPYAVLPAGSDTSLRRRFRVARSEFVIVLLGEDGEEKLRVRKPISVLALDRLIDTMPGRKREVRSHSAHPGRP